MCPCRLCILGKSRPQSWHRCDEVFFPVNALSPPATGAPPAADSSREAADSECDRKKCCWRSATLGYVLSHIVHLSGEAAALRSCALRWALSVAILEQILGHSGHWNS